MNLLERYFLPDSYAKNVFSVDLSALKARGIQLILCDIDNTLVAYDDPHPDQFAREFIAKVHESGMKVVLISNNTQKRVSAFADKCNQNNIDFTSRIEVDDVNCDEIMLSTIISNAMDNAINAQKKVLSDRRKINLMMKKYNDKLLISVKNTIAEKPLFYDGVPFAKEKDHGYGTQSIILLTTRMGGKYHFDVEDDLFIFRAVI